MRNRYFAYQTSSKCHINTVAKKKKCVTLNLFKFSKKNFRDILYDFPILWCFKQNVMNFQLKK